MASGKDNNVIDISNFNFGGLSDSKFSGVKYSLYKLIGLDLHSTPGILKAAQKLTKDSGDTVDEFVKCMVVSTNGNSYHFSSTSGKVWERASDGTWSLVYTTVPTGDDAGCLGAREYQGTIYWATEGYLHKIVAADAIGATEWTANAVPNWKAFDIKDPNFHPMEEQNLVLYIGDGNQVAQVDAGVFSSNALDIASPLRIKCLGKIGTDLLIGTTIDDNINRTQIIRWNTYSISFTNSDELPETGINAFIPGDNVVYVNAGIRGNIYVYTGDQCILFRTIPGEYSSTAYGRIHPNAAANFNGKILLGFSKFY